MSSNLQNSIWPNAGGTLGQIKVQIPDGVNTPWPTGDALVHNFVFNEGKLVGFVDTKALIANSSKTTTFPYDYVNISLPSIAEGEMTYNHDQCTYFVLNGKVIKGDVPTNEELEIITKKYIGCSTLADIKAVDPNYLTNDIIDGVWTEGLGDLVDASVGEDDGMFSYSNLAEISSNLSSLTNGQGMFKGTQLGYFDIDLPNLDNGSQMFRGCENLSSFNSYLSKLTNGNHMFTYSSLESFSADLSKLTNGYYMFYQCPKLKSFSSNLSSLTNGTNMFHSCPLTSFNSDLSSLEDAWSMFYGCYLDTASVKNIADTINTGTGQTIEIGIGKQGLSTDDNTYLQQIRNKGWSVYGTCNGYPDGSQGSQDDPSGYYGTAASASLTSLDEIDETEMFAPKPYWAKPFNADEKRARYVDSEGNFYNILGGHYIYVDDPDTYGMFINEEDAAAQMRLTRIVNE